MAHDRLAYLSTRRPDVAVSQELSHEYWYRPGELLVDADDVGRIEDEFAGWEIRPLTPERARVIAEQTAERTNVAPRPVEEAFEAAARRGIVRFETGARMHVPSLVQRFRQRPAGPGTGEFEPRVAPHHILMGEQIYTGSPADDPEPAGEEDWDAPAPGEHDGTVVAVLDTGLAPHAALAARCEAEPGGADVADADGDGARDDQAGHGTFVAGRVLAAAPRTRVRAYRVLDSWGVTDELTLAACLDRIGEGGDVDVINLSLGGYTHDNTAPMALSRALGRLPAGTAVVAAAGNYGRTRPFWPAALKRCLAVAALDGTGGRAEFTNFGWWVDACAPGAAVASTFLDYDDSGGSGHRFAGWARWSGTSFAAPRVASAIAAGVGAAADARDAAARLLRESPQHERWGLGVVVA